MSEITTPRRRPAILVADAAGLDFLNSVASPGGERVEWLADGAGLLDWIAQAGLAPADVLRDLRARATDAELDAVAGQARALREWFRAFVARHRGAPLPASALTELQPLNEVLAGDEGFRVLAAAATPGAPLTLSRQRRWRDAGSLLLPLAEALGELAAQADFTLVKHCEGPGCTLMFLDKTKGHARRWCSMAACGNRAKQAAHRARARDDAAPPR